LQPTERRRRVREAGRCRCHVRCVISGLQASQRYIENLKNLRPHNDNVIFSATTADIGCRPGPKLDRR
jgi:hypothetical protein